MVALAERGPLIALLVVILTVIVGSFDGDVLQPLVMGKAVNLHPLAIILAIAAGSIALGIVGALIAVPIAGAIYGVAKYLTGRDPEHSLSAYSPVHTQPESVDQSRHAIAWTNSAHLCCQWADHSCCHAINVQFARADVFIRLRDFFLIPSVPFFGFAAFTLF